MVASNNKYLKESTRYISWNVVVIRTSKSVHNNNNNPSSQKLRKKKENFYTSIWICQETQYLFLEYNFDKSFSKSFY